MWICVWLQVSQQVCRGASELQVIQKVCVCVVSEFQVSQQVCGWFV